MCVSSPFVQTDPTEERRRRLAAVQRLVVWFGFKPLWQRLIGTNTATTTDPGPGEQCPHSTHKPIQSNAMQSHWARKRENKVGELKVDIPPSYNLRSGLGTDRSMFRSLVTIDIVKTC